MGERLFEKSALSFGRQLGLEIQHVEPMDNGHNSNVFYLQTSLGAFVLRLQASESNRFAIEKETVNSLAATGSLVLPNILETGDVECSGEMVAYSLAEFIPGTPLNSFVSDASQPEEKKILALNNLGHELKVLHNLASSGYGLLRQRGVGEYESTEEWGMAIKERLYRTLVRTTVPFDWQVISNFDSLSTIDGLVSPPVISHGDFVPRNIIVNPQSGATSGIIDFEHAKSHVPELDIAYWRFYWQGEEATRALLEGYGDSLDKSLVDTLAITRGFDAMAYWMEMNDTQKVKAVTERIKALTNEKV